jgi:hypothetical protein
MSKLNKDILNEINRYREISGLSPIEEQERDINGKKIKKPKGKKNRGDDASASWNNGLSGNVNLDPESAKIKGNRIATNIGGDDLYLVYGSRALSAQPVSKTETKVITMPSFSLVGGDLNYPDNCVLPNISGGEAKVKFDNIVNSFVNYINNGGFDKIESIVIKGSADSGKPTLSNNDHIKAGYSKPFNGATDPYEMNQFLADERARQYGILVNNEVEKQTEIKIDSKYKYLKGENHYGKSKPGEDRVGERKIDFIVNAPELKVDDKVETTTTTTPVDETPKPAKIIIYKPNGDIVEKEGVKIISGAIRKDNHYGFYEDDEALSEIIQIPRTTVNGKIERNSLILDGKEVCKLVPFSEWRNIVSPEPPQSSGTKYFCRVTSQYVTIEGVRTLKDYIFQLKKELTNPYAGYYGRG